MDIKDRDLQGTRLKQFREVFYAYATYFVGIFFISFSGFGCVRRFSQSKSRKWFQQISIEQLTRTLAQGAYTHPDDIDIPAQTKLNVQLREKPVELNNRTLAQKYANTSSNKAAANSAYLG